MNKILTRDAKSLFLDKTRIQHIVALQNAKMGFVPDPNANAEMAQQIMLDEGIRAEDNIFSCGIIAARNEE